MTRVLVCGSRDWTDKAHIKQVLEDYRFNGYISLIHGDCRGADRIGGEIAETWDWPVDKFPADWINKGKAAGFIRNQQMVDEGEPTVVLAFVLNASRGTKDMCDRAYKHGIECHIYHHD